MHGVGGRHCCKLSDVINKWLFMQILESFVSTLMVSSIIGVVGTCLVVDGGNEGEVGGVPDPCG